MAIANIKTWSDADFVRGFIYKVGGVGSSLAGKKMRMIVRKKAEDATAVLSLTSDAGDILMTNSPTGAFSIRIKRVELAKMDAGEYVHSLVMSDNVSGIVTPIWRGKLTHALGPSR